ncbi:MAG: TatD family hydrolase [bacterium]
MFIDTHCHLNLIAKKKFDILLNQNEIEKGLQKVLDDAKKVGVEIILTVGTSVIESNNCINIAKTFASVYSIVGIHPCDCTQDWQDDFKYIEKIVQNKIENKIVGIGETGLDFYHKPYDENRQLIAFEKHIELAIKNNLPLVVHVRESVDSVFDVLRNYKNNVKGVIHCFSADKGAAKKFLDLGFYLGFGGPVTYPKNQIIKDVLTYVPLDKILLETDAPFLPPQQFRGKVNLPEYIPIFAKTISEIKNIELSILEEETTNNAKILFSV